MTSTATYGTTTDPYLNGVLSGIKWGVNALTFSFPTSSGFYGSSYAGGENLNNFKAFTAAQASAVRDTLKMYAGYSGLTFNEVTESATVHGELRYAESDSPSTAWAYYPSAASAGGDAWFNNSRHYYDNPVRGNYAWLTIMHETGHALGLKHPHEASGSFAALPTDRDSLEYTVMSYRSYIGASTTTGYTNGSTSYPQTLMMLDIAGIQKLYGANYSTNAGNTVYSWNPTTGTMSLDGVAQAAPAGNKIFMTIWDGGGNDTYSFSAYTTGVKVDLAAGAWTTASTTQLALLGSGHYAAGNIANALLYNGNTASLIENAVGGSGADTIAGNQADNRLTGGAGNDTLDGRDGNDTAVYSGAASFYSYVRNTDSSWTVIDSRGTDGTDTLRNVEYLQFADQTVQVGTSTTVTTTTTTTTTTTPTPVNQAPTANADFYTTGTNTRLTVLVNKGLLVNDADPEGQALKAVLVSGPTKGSLSLKSDGSFVYTPANKYNGIVTFKYAVSDGALTSAATTVTIGVGAAASNTVRTMQASKGADFVDLSDDQAPGVAKTTARHGLTNLWNTDDVFHLTSRPTFNPGSHLTENVTSGIDAVLSSLNSLPDSWHFGNPGGHHVPSWTPDFMKFDHFII